MGIHQNITSCVDSVSIVAFDSILTKRIDISDISESLISEDHTSEGFIVMLENGDIVNFYRMDPGYNGDHVGNNARIMKRISSDNGQTWQTPLLVYNDPAFDDRNIQGGLIGKDSIVLFFRKFNAPNWQQIGLFFIHSFDGGVSWTEPTQLSTHLTNCAFGTSKIIHIPDRGFILPVYRDYYVELRLSTDGFNWDSVIWIWDYRTTWQYRISEASFAYTGNGHIVGIMRNDRVGLGQNYFMVYSSDYGYTWTNPQNTNLAYPYTCPAPLMFYDEDHDDIWTIVTDRRSNISGLTADVESIWIYRNKIDEIANNPQGFNLVKTLDRPLPSNFRMYGYPAQQKLNTNEYLIVFTESFLKENGKEACVKYQFNLKYDSVILAIETFAWNNGANSSSITVYDSGNYDVIMTDQDGNVYIESMQIYIDNYPVNIYSGDTIFVSDIAMLDAGNTGKQYLWSTGDTTQIITVYIQDWYYVTITNSCDNFAVDSVYVIFDIVGNDEDTYPFEISVYPNPASEFLYIELPYGINDAFISIWSYSGELLQKQEYNGQHINISHLPIGMYLIEIETDEMIFREKFIKEDY
jgi:hypothetical protein